MDGQNGKSPEAGEQKARAYHLPTGIDEGRKRVLAIGRRDSGSQTAENS
jgi:hypothetical protein